MIYGMLDVKHPWIDENDNIVNPKDRTVPPSFGIVGYEKLRIVADYCLVALYDLGS